MKKFDSRRICVALVLLVVTSHAATYNVVPDNGSATIGCGTSIDPCATIEVAVATGAGIIGDHTLVLAPGTHAVASGIDLGTTSWIITSSSGNPEDTIVDFGSGPGFQQLTGATSLSVSGIGFRNGVQADGGCFFTQAVTISMDDVTFENCHATAGDGGGLYVRQPAGITDIDLNNVVVTGCTSSGGSFGGGVFLEGEPLKGTADGLTITNCSISNGGGTGTGAGMAIFSDTYVRDDFRLINSYIGDCRADGGAGGIYVRRGTLYNVTVEDCSCDLYEGGGIGATGGAMEAWDLTVRRCRAGRDGGGVHINNPSFTTLLVDAVVEDNECLRDGAGVQAINDLILEDSLIAGNTAYLSGGGLFCGSSPGGTITLRGNTKIIENMCGDGGGGAIMEGANCIMVIDDVDTVIIRDNAALTGPENLDCDSCGGSFYPCNGCSSMGKCAWNQPGDIDITSGCRCSPGVADDPARPGVCDHCVRAGHVFNSTTERCEPNTETEEPLVDDTPIDDEDEQQVNLDEVTASLEEIQTSLDGLSLTCEAAESQASSVGFTSFAGAAIPAVVVGLVSLACFLLPRKSAGTGTGSETTFSDTTP